MMGSHTLDVLRQGLWASLTGGWFFDPNQNIFCNTAHLYLWLFFLCFPLTLHLTLPSSLALWAIYCAVIGLVFLTIKFLNFRLHSMFDSSELQEDDLSEGELRSERDRDEEGLPGKDDNQLNKNTSHRDNKEWVEMEVINEKDQRSAMTPPVECSSRNSVTGSREGSGRRRTPVDSLELLHRATGSDVGQPKRGSLDLKVDVHRSDSRDRSRESGYTNGNDATDAGGLAEGGDGHDSMMLSTVLTPMGSPGRKRGEGDQPRKTKESLNASEEGAAAFPTGSGDTPVKGDSNEQNQTEKPKRDAAHRIKSRRHRKAVRRSRSALETRLNTEIGPLETYEPDLDSPDPKVRPRQFSLPERGLSGGKYKVTRDLSINSPSKNAPLWESSQSQPNPLTPLPVEEDTEKPVFKQPPKPVVEGPADVDAVGFRPRSQTPSTRSMEHMRRRHNKAKGKRSKSMLDAPAQSCDDPAPIKFNIVSDQSKALRYQSPHPVDLLTNNDLMTRSACACISQRQNVHKTHHSSHVSHSENDITRGRHKSQLRNRHHRAKSATPRKLKGRSYPTVHESLQKDPRLIRSAVKPRKLKPKPLFRLPMRHLGSNEDASSLPASQESSMVGLDWLFSDSDSPTSSEGRTDLSDSSSTLTNDEDDDSRRLPRGIPSSKVAPLPSRLLDDSTTSPDESMTSPEPTSPDRIDMPMLPGLGAIRKQHDPDGDPKDSSAVMLDREKMTQRLIEIFSNNDLMSYEEELKKLKEELASARKPEPESDTEEIPALEQGGAVGGARPKTRSRPSERTPTNQEQTCSSRESSASNHNESSSLLPVGTQEPLPEAKTEARRRRRHTSRSMKRDSLQDSGRSQGPPDSIERLISTEDGKHVASSHDDTTEGAVHCFQDEYGKWYTYTFGDSSGIAQGVTDVSFKDKDATKEDTKWETSTDSGSTVVLDAPPVSTRNIDAVLMERVPPSLSSHRGLQRRSPLQSYVQALFESGRLQQFGSETTTETETTHNVTGIDDKPKQYYKFWIVPFQYIKVRFDRLALLALLDRNNVIENLMSVLLAVLVGVLGAMLLTRGFYKDIWIFILCFVVASCQYSLLKSVQPDAASPMHGYNRVIAYSRPFYFCVCAGLVLVLHETSKHWSGSSFVLYGLHITTKPSLVFARDLILVLLLCFPIMFTVGLLPQVNTFTMYLLEQIEIHIFGGSATSSLTGAIFTVCRSLLGIAVLYGFCYAGLKEADKSQHVLFSIFCGLLVSVTYHLSRSATDPSVLWQIFKKAVIPPSPPEENAEEAEPETEELVDPLPDKLRKSVFERMRSDLIVCCVAAVLVFAVHVSTVFTSKVLQPTLFDILCYIAGSIGLIVHYIIPQLRKEMPWLCCAHPILPAHERDIFEVREAARVTWFEKAYIWLRFFERNVMYPAVLLGAITISAETIIDHNKFGSLWGNSLVIVLCSFKVFRGAFVDTPRQHLVLVFTFFFFKYDYRQADETFLINYFIFSIIFSKFYELLLKVRFIIVYIAPWQITWGSAFHAFAQPFSVPHSAMLFVQAAISAVFSTPLNPFLGSAIFITSYVRPVKFWERDYNTKRVDHTNTRLSSQLEQNPGADDNNLNSIFYEHLTRSLQHSLCGDLLLGRWGNAAQGDCFIMASDYLNALVHIVEMGNGLVTFQLRGLEFRGTYCQQREVEAITESVAEDRGCCCCELGHAPHCLSLNALLSQRWLAWEVVVTKYVLEGYSISDNSAASMLQVFDLRKVLITYYIKSIIYYTVRSPKLEVWLNNETIQEALQLAMVKNYVDLDATFSVIFDEDYDCRASGISKSSFCNVYLEWIQHCVSRREQAVDSSKEAWLVTLCYGLSLLGRRALGTASHYAATNSVDFFLFGLHALFKGDFRITSTRDEWVFTDMELLRRVVAPAVRMSLKLHQDHFTSPDQYDDHQLLYDAITTHEESLVISHEADPAWRNAVLTNTPSLLALRHVFDEGSDEYKIIMLNKRYLNFRVIKVNRECVRGLWAGQQQELVFLRNRNPERGSIQNAKQALRNMINSSCDQPIGYPIYVSPLVTSYSGTNEQYIGVTGKEFSLKGAIAALRDLWRRMRVRCGAGCSSGSVVEEGIVPPGTNPNNEQAQQPGVPPTVGLNPVDGSHLTLNTRGSLVSTASSASKPSTALASLAGLISDNNSAKEPLNQKVLLKDTNCVLATLSSGRMVQWPNETWREKGGRSQWQGWTPERGMEGVVVHRWVPCHRDMLKRSHLDKTILLVQIGDRYVPILEYGLEDLGAEV